MFSAWSNLCLQDMLKTRTALPISEVKNDILQHLKERDVLVVCGETGSGKTTQVLSFCSLSFDFCSLIALFAEFIFQLTVESFLTDTLFQVPQFILDDMIESGRGGYCNIICTQPRRIAVSNSVLRCVAFRDSLFSSYWPFYLWNDYIS